MFKVVHVGTSYVYDQPVLSLIYERLPISLYFGLIGFLLTYSICIPLGIKVGQIAYLRFDSMFLAVVLGVVSIPIAFFVIAYALMFLIVLPMALLGRTSPRDEYFDDPP